MNDLMIAFIIFFIGIFGYLTSKNILIKYILSAEIIFLSSIYLFLTSDSIYQKNIGMIFSIFIIAISIVDIAVYIFLILKKDEK